MARRAQRSEYPRPGHATTGTRWPGCEESRERRNGLCRDTIALEHQIF